MLAYGSATTRWDGYMGPFFAFSSLVFCFGDDKARSRQAMIRITTLVGANGRHDFASERRDGFFWV